MYILTKTSGNITKEIFGIQSEVFGIISTLINDLTIQQFMMKPDLGCTIFSIWTSSEVGMVQFMMFPKSRMVQSMMLPKSGMVQFMMPAKSEVVQFMLQII